MTTGVFLDIDGTVIELQETGVHRDAFIFGVQCAFDLALCDFQYRGLEGLTERRIFFEVLRRYGYSDKDIGLGLNNAYYFMREFCGRYLDSLSVKLLPGARELLDALKNVGVEMCWASGTIGGVASYKLTESGLASYGLPGIFGDAFYERSEMLKAGAELLGVEGECRLFVIGDTVADVRAAKGAGMISIAVATGRQSVDELRNAGADYVFEDLTDTEGLLEIIRS